MRCRQEYKAIFMPSFNSQVFVNLSVRTVFERSSVLFKNEPMRYGFCQVTFGWLFLLFKGDVLVRIAAAERLEDLKRLIEVEWRMANARDIETVGHALLSETFCGSCFLCVTPFQLSVLQALTTIRFGELISYGDLAVRIQRSHCARAVGRALGANPLAILLPCHRVVSSNGDFGGYRWGRSIKKTLIERERQDRR